MKRVNIDELAYCVFVHRLCPYIGVLNVPVPFLVLEEKDDHRCLGCL